MVNITKFAVRKPVTIIMCLITIAYFGIQALMGTKVELTPEMELPVLLISTVYAGATPEDINDLVTTKQEDAIPHWTALKMYTAFPRKMFPSSWWSMSSEPILIRHTST